MADRVFSDDAVARFLAHYPQRPARIAHGLLGHPLLELEALAALAARLDPSEVEYNRGRLPIGISQEATPSNGLSIAETISSIEKNESWMVLKRVEKDPVYRKLLHDTLAELRPAIRPVTGEMIRLEGFIFFSSPGAVTPFHFDPEYNILCQLRGSKTMTVFPADLATSQFHEDYHRGGQRNLPWREDYAALGQSFDLAPGEGIYVPLMAPHWVRNGDAVSISFSITWRSEWSFREAYAHRFNGVARRFGLNPAPPRPFPGDNHLKAAAFRGMRKAGELISQLRR